MLHPQAEVALAQWSQAPSVTDPSYGLEDLQAERRSARDAAALEEREPCARVVDVDADGVSCRIYVPDDADGVVVFAHGGGFVFGDVVTHDAQARRVANRTGMAVLAVNYRRPPEHRFPAAPDDLDTVVRWLSTQAAESALDTATVVALGDSAGANLALVAALRNPGSFAALVLVYPFLDPAQKADTYRTEDAHGLSRRECDWFWEQYAAAPEDLDDPDLAPLLSTRLQTLPPTLVQSAQHDVLLGEDLVLVSRLERVGVPVESTTYPGMIHGFWRHPEAFDAAEVALAEAADFLRRRR